MATVENSQSSHICSICIDTFKNPKLLPCCHSFCFECLQQFVSKSSKDGHFLCPMCGEQVIIPKKGVEGFKPNIYVESRSEKYGTVECIEAEMEKLLLSKEKICEKHLDEKLKFYCVPCSKLICRDCKLTDHENHKTKDICDVAETSRTNLAEAKVKLEKYKTEIDETIEEIKQTNMNMSIKIDKKKMEINEFVVNLAESIGKVIHDAKVHQLTRLTSVEDSQMKKITHEQEILSQRKSFIQSQIDHLKTTLRGGVDSDVVITDGEIQARLEEIDKEQDPTDYVVNIPPTRAVSSSKMESVSCVVNDIIRNSFPVDYQLLVPVIIKNITYGKQRIHCISFTKTNKVWITWGDMDHELCLFEIPCTKPDHRLPVRLDDMKKDGVHGFINKYNEDNETDHKIPATEFNHLKKGFVSKDTNANGDRCKVDDEYDVVIIKYVDGDCRTISYSSFATSGQQFKPVDVCWGSNEEIYILDSGSRKIIVYSVFCGFQKSYTSANVCPNATAISMNKEGELWIGDNAGTVHICSV